MSVIANVLLMNCMLWRQKFVKSLSTVFHVHVSWQMLFFLDPTLDFQAPCTTKKVVLTKLSVDGTKVDVLLGDMK